MTKLLQSFEKLESHCKDLADKSSIKTLVSEFRSVLNSPESKLDRITATEIKSKRLPEIIDLIYSTIIDELVPLHSDLWTFLNKVAPAKEEKKIIFASLTKDQIKAMLEKLKKH